MRWGLALVCAIVFALPANAFAGVVISDASLDFGTLTVSDSVSRQVTVTNTGTTAVKSTGGVSTGVSNFGANPDGCFLVSLAAGASCTATINFHPTVVGPRTGSVRWNFDDGSNATITLSGTGTPQVTISDATLDFGTVPVNANASRAVTITNIGSEPVRWIGRVGTSASQFGVDPDGCFGVTLTAGASCTTNVTFHPTTTGPHSGSSAWNFTDAFGGTPGVVVNLTGTGSPQLAISSSSIDFGEVAVNGRASLQVTLTNQGLTPLKWIGETGTSASQFEGAFTGCFAVTLAGGASCTATLIFHPTSVGPKSGEHHWNFEGSPIISASLTGTGIPDTVPPVLTTPGTLTAEATSAAGAAANFTVTAMDAVSGSSAVTCTPVSGSTFVLGTTTVSCSATDDAGNTGTATFDVTVVDTTAPAIGGIPANRVVEATSPGGATVTYTLPTATDLVDGTVTVVCSPSSGTTFALGTKSVLCTATDAHLNKATAGFDVTVRDTTPPTLTLPANIWTPATSPAGAAVAFTATASDLVSGTVGVTCAPTSGAALTVGDTVVSCSATDAALNTANGSFTVHVAGALELLGLLKSASIGVVPGKSLENKAADASAAATAGDTATACTTLQSYSSELVAQTGKKVTTAKSAELARLVAQARAALGC